MAEEKNVSTPETEEVKAEEVTAAAEQAEEKTEKKKKKSKDKEEIEALKAALAAKEEELANQKQTYLRVLAEYDNFRKRSANEKTMVYGNAVSDTVGAILPIADNIDRALAQKNADAESMYKGVEMIANQIAASFEKLGITVIGEVGEEFNPELHNAVSHIDSDDFGDNVISVVLQKGYKLGDKVVRYAMVQVAN